MQLILIILQYVYCRDIQEKGVFAMKRYVQGSVHVCKKDIIMGYTKPVLKSQWVSVKNSVLPLSTMFTYDLETLLFFASVFLGRQTLVYFLRKYTIILKLF